MKKNYLKMILIPCALIVSAGISTAQVAELDACPTFNLSKNEKPNAMWSVVFNYDLVASTGANENTGVCFVNNEFWVSKWQNDTISILNATGGFVQKIQVPGVYGTRSLTYDGSKIYAGVNTSMVQIIDPGTKTTSGTITAPITNVRSLTYDATANGGAGGFWGSSWGTDIVQFSKTGTTLNTLWSADHLLTGMYGTAYDGTSPGGPFLWVFDQASSIAKSDIVQINATTGFPMNVMHDVMSDVGATANDTSGLAGGLFFTTLNSVPTLMGVLQGRPTDRLFGYEINTTGIGENEALVGSVTVFPNPVVDFANIKVDRKNSNPATLEIIDMVGKVVYETSTVGANNYFNLSKYESGLYFARYTCNGQSYTTKLVKE